MSRRSAAACHPAGLHGSAELRRVVNSFLARWLCTCSRTFGGDLVTMQVLSAVALACLGDEAGSGACSPSEIARRTCVPRQTVIRRLGAMAAKGWVVRRADGRWTLDRSSTPPVVASDLGADWEAVLGMIATLAMDLARRSAGKDGASE